MEQPQDIFSSDNSNESIGDMVKNQKKRKRVHIFNFPSGSIKNYTFHSVEQIKQIMKNQEKNQGPYKKNLWRICIRAPENKPKFMYYKCRYCQAQVSFLRKSQNNWIVKTYQGDHEHNPRISKKKNQEAIVRYVQQNINVYDRPNLTFMKHKMKESLKITDRDIWHLYRGVWASPNTYPQLEEFFKQNHFKAIVYWREEQKQRKGFPDTILAVSEDMRNNYLKFGDSVSFDITYNCIKNINLEQKSHGVGLFSGWDTNKRLLIFGLVLIMNQDTQTLVKVFKDFFSLAGAVPESIVTDQQVSLGKAIEVLKQMDIFHGIQVYDVWHILHNLRVNLAKMVKKYDKQELNRTIEYVRRMRDVIQMKHIYDGKKNLQQIGKQLQKNYSYEDVLHKFLSKIDKVCFWMIPPRYVGLSRATNQKLNDLLKSKIQFETNLQTVLKAANQVSKELSLKSITTFELYRQPVEKLYEDDRLRQVRLKIQKRVFKAFFENYIQSRENYTLKQSVINQFECNFLVFNRKSLENFNIYKWMCECKYFEKTGIPCSHVLFATKQVPNISYLQFFNPRWIKQDTEDVNTEKYTMRYLNDQ